MCEVLPSQIHVQMMHPPTQMTHGGPHQVGSRHPMYLAVEMVLGTCNNHQRPLNRFSKKVELHVASPKDGWLTNT